MSKPTPDDIRAAIKLAENGGWIDADLEPYSWLCKLYNPDGKRVGDGCADTAEEAMGLAWVCAMSPAALDKAYVEPGSVPFDVPDGWRFELNAKT